MSIRRTGALLIGAVTITLLAACSAAPGSSNGPAATGVTPAQTVDTGGPAKTASNPGPTYAYETTVPKDTGVRWPATVHVTLSGTTTGVDGDYAATGISQQCGNSLWVAGPDYPGFEFDFPIEGHFTIENINFGSSSLVLGVTTEDFLLGITINPPDGHVVPATVVNPADSRLSDTGTAKMTEADGKRYLVADGADELGQTLHLDAVCGPAPAP